MSYIHTDGVKYSDDKKTLVHCPQEATEITILDSVTSIGKGAFWGCYRLISIVIPDSVTSIGEKAFHCCSGLTSIVISDSRGTHSKLHCSNQHSFFSHINLFVKKLINCNDGVTSIGKDAFSGCSGLKEIRIPKGTRDKFCAMPGLKKYENLLVEYKKE